MSGTATLTMTASQKKRAFDVLIVGAFVGGWLFAKLGIFIVSGVIGTIIAATAGAIVLLLLIRLCGACNAPFRGAAFP